MKDYRDIEGDGGSRIIDQVMAKSQRIAENLAGIRSIVAIGSGKGGVGKSTLTHQLAVALREDGARVAILDADLNGPTQARLSGLPVAPPLPGKGGFALARDRSGIGVVSMGTLFPEEVAVDFGEPAAAGSSHTWRGIREAGVLTDLLATVEWGDLEVLFIDLPPGAERIVQYAELLGPRTAFILVTLPSELSRGVVSRSLAALRRTPNRVLGLIENMAGYHCPDCDAIRPLFPRAATPGLDVPTLGEVPFDPRLAARCDRGESSREDARGAASAIRAIALKVRDALEEK